MSAKIFRVSNTVIELDNGGKDFSNQLLRLRLKNNNIVCSATFCETEHLKEVEITKLNKDDALKLIHALLDMYSALE